MGGKTYTVCIVLYACTIKKLGPKSNFGWMPFLLHTMAYIGQKKSVSTWIG